MTEMHTAYNLDEIIRRGKVAASRTENSGSRESLIMEYGAVAILRQSEATFLKGIKR